MSDSTEERLQLAAAVAASDRRRERAWRIRFRLVSAAILGLIVAFIVTYLNVEASFITKAAPFILAGAGLTIAVSLLSIILATALATFGALGRLSRSATANAIASFYVSFFRGTPLLLQLLFWYLALPQIGRAHV